MTPEEIINAELTLLAMTEGADELALVALLEELGVLRGEYDYLCKKYSHLIERLKKEQAND